MDREDWCAAVCGVTKSWTWQSNWTELRTLGRVLLSTFPLKTGFLGFIHIANCYKNAVKSHIEINCCSKFSSQLSQEMDESRFGQISNPDLINSARNSVQFSSVAQSCLTLCDPMNRSTPGLPVHHQLPEFTQTHVNWVSDAIQPSHPSSVVPFSSCPQSLPASESFPMNFAHSEAS